MGLARGLLFLTGAETVAGQARGGSAALDAATGALTEWTAGIPLSGVLLAPDGETLYSTYIPYDEDEAAVQVAISTRDGAELAWAADARGGGAKVISRDGTRMFLGASAINTRFRPGSAMLDETAHIVPWAGPLELAYRDTTDTELSTSGAAFAVRYFESSRRASVFGLAPDGVRAWQLSADGSASIALSPDEETLYVTGSFTQLGGVARPGFAAVRAADGAVLPWAPVAGGGVINGTVPTRDGRTLYVYGTFTSIDGMPRRGAAALDVATGAVLAFDGRVEGPVYVAKLSPDERVLYVSGSFTAVAGIARRNIAGVSTEDGRLVFRPPIDSFVRDFQPLADGRTVVVAADLDDMPLTAWDARDSGQLDWDPLDQPCSGDCTVSEARARQPLPARGRRLQGQRPVRELRADPARRRCGGAGERAAAEREGRDGVQHLCRVRSGPLDRPARHVPLRMAGRRRARGGLRRPRVPADAVRPRQDRVVRGERGRRVRAQRADLGHGRRRVHPRAAPEADAAGRAAADADGRRRHRDRRPGADP